MSDLSRLLGDVYNQDAPPATTTADDIDAADDGGGGAGTGTEDAARRESGPTGTLPEWADEGVLDEAFASWVPGPPADAPVAERTMLTDIAGGPKEGKERDGDVDAADRPTAGEPVAAAEPSGEPPAPMPVPAVAVADPTPEWRGGWQRSDDDILPARTKGGLFRR